MIFAALFIAFRSIKKLLVKTSEARAIHKFKQFLHDFFHCPSNPVKIDFVMTCFLRAEKKRERATSAFEYKDLCTKVASLSLYGWAALYFSDRRSNREK